MNVIELKNLNYNHWDYENLKGYIYTDFVDESLFNSLKKIVISYIDYQNKNTFLTNNTIFNFNGKSVKLISNPSNDRYQNVIFDLTLHPEWYYQTSDTIKEWSVNVLNNTISPVFLKFLKKVEENSVINIEKEKWIPIRQHINILAYDKLLGMHLDSSALHFNNENPNVLSLTFYLDDHVENCGGELFTLHGFVYKPKANSCIMFNGSQVYHGVTQNKHPEKKTRQAFSIRFAHIDDLFLPGHPSKHLWKLDHL